MGETIEFIKNDTTRAIERQMEHIRKWADGNERCNLDATDQVLIKLEEAWMWSLQMVKPE